MSENLQVALFGLACVLGAVLFVKRMYRRGDYLPPPSKDVNREHDAGWWS